MEFRLASLADITVLEQMEQANLECPYSASVLEGTITDEQSKILLLTDGKKIIGYGGYKMIFDTAEVYNIVVGLEYRRMGYGKLILQHIIANAQAIGASEMFLEVNENNLPAINLYKLFGFSQISIRKNYYKTGNALIMKKDL